MALKITKISQIFDFLRNDSSKKRLVVAYANDEHSIETVYHAIEEDLVEGILVGDYGVIKNICDEQGYDISKFKIIHETVPEVCASQAVRMIREGEADFIMKGLVSTDRYMRAILDKDNGLVPSGATLSHVTVMEIAAYHKLLAISDSAVIPMPDLNQKKSIIKYVTNTIQALGVEVPKIALVAPTEQVLTKVQSTIDAAILAKMSERGQLGKAIVDGPMGLDVAIDKESAEIKSVKSPVAGDADGLVFSNLDAANVFYKTNSKLGCAKIGSVLVGATAPSVLSSRGDSVDTKLNSIALAAMLAKYNSGSKKK